MIALFDDHLPENPREMRKLLRKLEKAYQVCSDCGNAWGVYSVGISSVWHGKCDVCGQEANVTEARDYAYFITGRRKISKALKGD